MANFVFADRVKDSSSSYSSSSFTLSGTAPSGFQSFNAGIGDGNYCFYCVTDASGNWEVNYGAYTNSSTALARNSTPVASSNSGSAVTFSGSVTIFCDNPAKFIGAQENWGIKSGRVYINAGWSSNDDAGGKTLGFTSLVYYMPVRVRQPFSSVKLHFNLTALFAGTATVDIGIYDTLNGFPRTKLGSQTGINSGTGGSTGEIVTSTINTGVKPPGLYWVAFLPLTNVPTVLAGPGSIALHELLGSDSVTSGKATKSDLFVFEGGSSLPSTASSSPNPAGQDWVPFVGIEAIL